MSATGGLGALLVAAVLGQARRASAFGPPPPPPIPVSCYVAPQGTDYKYAPGNVFPDTPGHEHGRVYTDSAADCCALCQSLKNCSFYTFNNDGRDATPTCYGTPGPCCYLKTAAAASGRAAGAAGVVSGSTKPPPATPAAMRLHSMAYTMAGEKGVLLVNMQQITFC